MVLLSFFRVAFANALGIALVDYLQKKLVSVLMSYEIGGKLLLKYYTRPTSREH